MKLKNDNDNDTSKYTIDYALGIMSLLVLFISLRFFVAIIIVESAFAHPSFMLFLSENFGLENIPSAIGIISFIFSLIFCVCMCKAYKFLDKKFFATLKSGFVIRIILFLLPLLFTYSVRSDITEFKSKDNNDAFIARYAYSNPLEFIKSLADCNAIGYLVFDQNKKPHIIATKLEEGYNQVEIAKDFLSMKVSLDLAIDGKNLEISNIEVSAKVNNCQTDLISMKSDSLSISSTTIIMQSQCVSTSPEPTKELSYPTHLFIQKASATK